MDAERRIECGTMATLPRRAVAHHPSLDIELAAATGTDDDDLSRRGVK